VRDARQLAPPVAFLHLTVDQLRCHLPLECFLASATHLKPASKMGGQGIEIEIEAITREEREAARGPGSVVRACLKRDDSRGIEAVHLEYEQEPTVSNRSDRPKVGIVSKQ
jgi:hypothetical protein